MTIPRGALVFTGLGFLGFGLAYALWPLPMAQLTEIQLSTKSARIDFTATYGGFQIGFGIFLLVCVKRPGWTEPGLWAAAAALTGFVLTRLLAIAATGWEANHSIWLGLMLELGAALLNAFGLWQFRRTAEPGPTPGA
jgi:uncharacterized protein DUF4345